MKQDICVISLKDICDFQSVIDTLQQNLKMGAGVRVLRYCASVLSIPAHATEITPIWRNDGLGHTDNFNKNTNIGYGFAYCINHQNSSQKVRMIEYEIASNVWASETISDQSYLWNIEKFIDHYSDEYFEKVSYPKYVKYEYFEDDEGYKHKYISEEEFDDYKLEQSSPTYISQDFLELRNNEDENDTYGNEEYYDEGYIPYDTIKQNEKMNKPVTIIIFKSEVEPIPIQVVEPILQVKQKNIKKDEKKVELPQQSFPVTVEETNPFVSQNRYILPINRNQPIQKKDDKSVIIKKLDNPPPVQAKGQWAMGTRNLINNGPIVIETIKKNKISLTDHKRIVNNSIDQIDDDDMDDDTDDEY